MSTCDFGGKEGEATSLVHKTAKVCFHHDSISKPIGRFESKQVLFREFGHLYLGLKDIHRTSMGRYGLHRWLDNFNEPQSLLTPESFQETALDPIMVLVLIG